MTTFPIESIVLRGSGGTLRHVRIEPPAEIDRAEIASLVQQSLEHDKA